MNFTKNWLRIGRLGFSLATASEPTIDCWTVLAIKTRSHKLSVLWLS